jgi:2'-5' RNA ligase
VRLFVALLLEPEWLAILASLQRRLQEHDAGGSVRWTDPKGIHLTLKFLGEVPEPRLPKLLGAFGPAVQGRRAPLLGLGATGAFPNLRRPRVLWIGVEERGTELPPLQAAIEDAAAELGWEREGRAFQPHLTLGRVRDFGHAGLSPGLGSALLENPATSTKPVHHPRVALMRSHLSPQGARYEEVCVWTLPTVG